MAAGAGAASQDETLVLSGSLRSMCLSDLLQWISLGRKTGRLYVERDALNKLVYLREGRILSTSSNNPREAFGHFLVSQKQITEVQLFRALVMQHKRKKLLGEILLQEGWVTEDAIRETLELKTRETLFEMFSWTEGRFHFYEEEPPENLRIALAVEISGLIFEGIQRIDDWTRIREQIPCGSTTFRSMTDRTDQGERDREVLEQVRHRKTVTQIAQGTNLSDYEASLVLCRLLQQGLIILDSSGEEQKPEETVRVLRRLIREGDEQFKAGRFAESQKTFGQVLKLDPLNQYAKIYLLRIRTRATSSAEREAISRDRIPVLRATDAVEGVRFTPQEVKVLALITGEQDVESIVAKAPFPEQETLDTLKRFLAQNIIALR